MKRFAVILVCILICLSLFSGCTGEKDSDGQNLPDSAEIDDVNGTADAGTTSDDGISDDGITYSFRDPESHGGIVVTPRG